MPSIHLIQRTLKVVSVDPNEVQRTESPTFAASVRRLKEDGHYQCWVCGTTENIQVHHYGSEWQYGTIVDMDELFNFVTNEFDVYGYGKVLKDQPITTVDDIRNCMCLCQPHHTGVDHADGGFGTGIHSGDFPTWIIQKLAKKGFEPVPQAGETEQDALNRLDADLGVAPSAEPTAPQA